MSVGSDFGTYFTRTFSIVTFLVGMGFALGYIPAYEANPGQIEFETLVTGLIILGGHGIVTNMKEVGIFRKLLCYLSGAAGGVVAFNVIMQLIG